MKVRLISAIIALIIAIPITIMGGMLFQIGVLILAMLGLKEFMDIKESKKKIPNFMKLISYLFVALITFSVTIDKDMNLVLNFKLLMGLILSLSLPVVLYHDRAIYSINDSFYLFFGTIFLGIAMSLFNIYREMGLDIIFFLVLVAIITDTYAYIVGRLIGKNKMLEVISPKKTWEGMIGGTFFGVFIPTMFYITVINNDIGLFTIIIVTLFLSIIGQFGDLFFSAIKRYYGKKDFSHIMPGHGGILDRLDSIIFIMLAYSFFLTLI